MNKKIVLVVFAVALTGVALPGVAAERVELKTDMEKNGYSVGYDIGRSLKRQLPDVDAASTAQGLKDAIGGVAPALPDQEIQQRFADVRQEAARKVPGVNLERGRGFLAR